MIQELPDCDNSDHVRVHRTRVLVHAGVGERVAIGAITGDATVEQSGRFHVVQQSAVVETPLDRVTLHDRDVHRTELNIADLDHDNWDGIFCAASRSACHCGDEAERGDPPPHY